MRDEQAHIVANDITIAYGSFVVQRELNFTVRRGDVFIPFCYHEAAANLLTNEALDPFGKIPEFKYCAVRVSAGGEQAAA